MNERPVDLMRKQRVLTKGFWHWLSAAFAVAPPSHAEPTFGGVPFKPRKFRISQTRRAKLRTRSNRIAMQKRSRRVNWGLL
jgi:hypothetical protein